MTGLVRGEAYREGGVLSRDAAPGVCIKYFSTLDALSRLRSRTGPYGPACSCACSRRSSCSSALAAGRAGSGAVNASGPRVALSTGDGPRRVAVSGAPGEGCGGSLEDVVAPGVVTVCSDPRELKNAGAAGWRVNSESKLESAGLLFAIVSL